MVISAMRLGEDYWEAFQLRDQDIEFLYNTLLETETPLSNRELLTLLVNERVRVERLAIEQQRSSGADIYYPKDSYAVGQKLVFPALNWRHGEVQEVRPGVNPELAAFDVIRIKFEGGESHEYASRVDDHALNQPVGVVGDDPSLNPAAVLEGHGDMLAERLDEGLQANADFVRIAGRWFPRALLVDINLGHLNLAEAVLDMAGGGPLPTAALLEQIEVASNVNPKLLEFSMDYALQEDPRFDEVGTAGEVLWFLRRLEPAEVRETPVYLRHVAIDYDRARLTPEMLALERAVDDELSPGDGKALPLADVEICLLYPHWRVGTLPLSSRTRLFFPTAYEAPRIRFDIRDGDTGESFPAWVVRQQRYVYGLKEWYDKRNLIPGSLVRVERSAKQGEVIIRSDMRRSSREWVRTVLVGSDGGIVFAMLRQVVASTIDERMAIAVPDPEAIDQVWERMQKERPPFEKVVVDVMRELTKLNPQGHVHASELYAATNIVRRCPPGPLLELLASRPWFDHVGDLHFRYSETEHK